MPAGRSSHGASLLVRRWRRDAHGLSGYGFTAKAVRARTGIAATRVRADRRTRVLADAQSARALASARARARELEIAGARRAAGVARLARRRCGRSVGF